MNRHPCASVKGTEHILPRYPLLHCTRKRKLFKHFFIKIFGLFEKRPPEAFKKGLEKKLIEVLVGLRDEARKKELFEFADEIRERMNEIGITLEDTPDGTIWRRS